MVECGVPGLDEPFPECPKSHYRYGLWSQKDLDLTP